MTRKTPDAQRQAPPEPDETPDALFNQSLEKGIAVLRAFSAQRRSMTLPEVAEATSITKSSAQRMIYTLEKLGYVRKHPRTKRYQLAPRVMQIGFNYLAADTLIDVANPFLSELTNVIGETTNLTEPDGVFQRVMQRLREPGLLCRVSHRDLLRRARGPACDGAELRQCRAPRRRIRWFGQLSLFDADHFRIAADRR